MWFFRQAGEQRREENERILQGEINARNARNARETSDLDFLSICKWAFGAGAVVSLVCPSAFAIIVAAVTKDIVTPIVIAATGDVLSIAAAGASICFAELAKDKKNQRDERYDNEIPIEIATKP